MAGCASGAATALLAGVALAELPIVVLVIALGWPLVAGACGLYTVSPLRTWASGVGEAPRLAVTSLLISWPVFGLLSSLGARAARDGRARRLGADGRRRRARPHASLARPSIAPPRCASAR